jgi:hypothetical protein
VTKHLLLDEFEHVDLLEQSPRLIAAAPGYIGEGAARVTFVCKGMQVRIDDTGRNDVQRAILMCCCYGVRRAPFLTDSPPSCGAEF